MKSFSMPLYTTGKQVKVGDNFYTIESVLISRSEILIKLKDKAELVNSRKVICPATVFQYEKRI